MTSLEKILIALVLTVACLVGAYWKGWLDGSRSERTKWEVKMQEAATKAGIERERLRNVSDRLSTEVRDAGIQIDTMAREISRLLTTRVSSTRRCFSVSAASLLDSMSPVRETTPAVAGADAPAATGAATHSDRPPPDDGAGASEHSVAVALIEARASYGKCVSQLHALQDVVTEMTE